MPILPFSRRKKRLHPLLLSLDIEFPQWEPGIVRVISRRAIREFALRHRDALEPLRHWANATERVVWKNPGELRRTFGTADFVGDLTVFNIAGNKYRLIAFVHYRAKAAYIKHILTHEEYDEGRWKR